MPARYAYLGPAGTFTEAALRQVVGPDEAEYLPQVDVVAAIEAVRTGAADFAVVAIESSVEGGVSAVLDSLAVGTPLVLLREMLVPVTFDLAARPGTVLGDVHRISAHPHAWAQCRRWLAAELPGVVHVPATSNTAPAALLAGSREDLGFEAALVPPPAVEHYGLSRVATGVADNDHAVTRFVLVGPPGEMPGPTGRDKTTLVVHLPSNKAGALLEMLEQFATRGVNLSRIESRPDRRLPRALLLLDRRRGAPRRGADGRGPHGPAPRLPARAVPRLLPACRRAVRRRPDRDDGRGLPRGARLGAVAARGEGLSPRGPAQSTLTISASRSTRASSS